MAITKVIKDLTEFNPGNPDYVLNATNAVTVSNASGSNKYYFNGVYDGKFGLRIGTTVLTGVPVAHPIAVLNDGLTGITYTGTFFNTLVVGGVTYNFYTGDVTITVTADFGVASYYCYYHGYMGGENNLVSVYSTAGLKMPSGAAYSGTAQDGMVRNDTDGDSQGSASTMQHFNGTDWKNYENLPNSITVDFLVVAGGGGGGAALVTNIGGGGGGAGGYRNSFNSENSGGGGASENSLNLGTGIAYNIEVGVAGAGSTSDAFGIAGGNSIFDSITSIGGGGGANYDVAGSTGGSGGGSYVLVSGGIGNNPGLGTNTTNGDATNQGFNGGTVVNGSSSGGGGGAGSVGLNSANTGATQTGNGGNGLESEISGSAVTRAGGGGGGRYSTEAGGPGTGGTGGGGTGGNQSNGADASPANSGSGGGGSADGYSGGSGSSGIIILRTTLSSAAFTAGVQVNGVTTSAGQVISPTAQGDGTHIYSITTAASGATITFS